MNALIEADATLQKLYTGTIWGEGPVWLPHQHSVRWSDIPNNRILQFDARTGATEVYSDDAEYTNGRTLDLAGEVVQCSHGRRAVERDAGDGAVTLVDSWNGRRLNSPNDVVVASDGSIWFTDPPYGIHPSGREGHPGTQEYDGCYVFHFDEGSGALTPVITDMVHPNGLAFSPDESVLYVSDTGSSGDGARAIRAYDVDVAGATATNGRVFAEITPGASDGFRIDSEGRVWTSSENAVQVLTPGGEVILRIPIPEKVSNVCFGGDDGHDLYVTASTSLYRIRTTVIQAPRRPSA